MYPRIRINGFFFKSSIFYGFLMDGGVMKIIKLLLCMAISASACANSDLRAQLEYFDTKLLLVKSYSEFWVSMDRVINHFDNGDLKKSAFLMGGIREILMEKLNHYSHGSTNKRAAKFAHGAAIRAKQLHRQLCAAADRDPVVGSKKRKKRKKQSGLRVACNVNA